MRKFKITVIAEAELTEKELVSWGQIFNKKGVKYVMNGCGGILPFMEERAKKPKVTITEAT